MIWQGALPAPPPTTVIDLGDHPIAHQCQSGLYAPMINPPNIKIFRALAPKAIMVIGICFTAATAHAQAAQESQKPGQLEKQEIETTPRRVGCSPPSGPSRTVVAVLDAQTLLLDDGSEVRLTGALPPFRPAPDATPTEARVSPSSPTAPWPPLVQAHQALVKLAQAQTVQLGATGGKPNRYGQILAQVYIIPQNSKDQPPRAPIWLQGYLIANGLARAHPSSALGPCLGKLIQLEGRARTAQAGLWNTAAFQIRDAGAPETLIGDIGSFQIIEGRVLRTGGGRNKFYLNFGKNWRRDFTVGINRKLVRQFARDGLNLRRLRGRTIRVRGWLEGRGGPYIQATSAAQIEVLADD